MFDLPAKPDLSQFTGYHTHQVWGRLSQFMEHTKSKKRCESQVSMLLTGVHRVQQLYPLIADKNINLVPNNYKRLVK